MSSPLAFGTLFCVRNRLRSLGNAEAVSFWIGLYLVPLVFRPGTLTVDADKARVAEVVALILLAVFVANNTIRVIPRPVCFATIYLLGSWLASTVLALGPQTAVLGGMLRGRGLLLELACLVWMAYAASRKVNSRFYVLIALSGTLPAISAVLARFGWLSNPGGTLGNTSFLRDYLAVCAVLLACVLFPRRWVWAGMAVALLAFGGWTLTPSRHLSIEYRERMWGALLPALAHYRWPLLGYGPESGVLVVNAYTANIYAAEPGSGTTAIGGRGASQDRTENLFLDAAIERGIPGALTELGFWLTIVMVGRRSPALPALLTGLILAQVSVISVPSLVLTFVVAGAVISTAEGVPRLGAERRVPVDKLRRGVVLLKPGRERGKGLAHPSDRPVPIEALG